MTNSHSIEGHMTEYPTLLSSQASATSALEMMKQLKIRHLPVLDQGKVIGVVSQRDLLRYELVSETMDLLVADIMTPNPYCVPIHTPLATVAREMAIHKYGCAIVLNATDRIVGIFTTTDAMRVLSELLTDPGARELYLGSVERFLSRKTTASQ